MQLDSVRGLKESLTKTVIAGLNESEPVAFTVTTGPRVRVHRTIALGVISKGRNDFELAVRLQRPELRNSEALDAIRKHAKGEVDVRYIGRVTKLAAKAPSHWYRKRQRPLRLGTSIGHFSVTAGTLGCIVKNRSDGTNMILSNNHVLANENDATPGDVILQPGHFDGGRRPGDVAGELARFIRLKSTSKNMVDCAVASIRETVQCDCKKLGDLGNLAGLGPTFLNHGTKVSKVGRATGESKGSVSAFELDNVVITYGMGDIIFDNQIEIEGTGSTTFSSGGDSGAVMVDGDLKGVGLLIAGSDQGGSNGKGVTYANPLKAVLDALKVDLSLC
jgi:hypothetical protein